MHSFQQDISAALPGDFAEPGAMSLKGSASFRSVFDVTGLALATTMAAVQEYAELIGAHHIEVDRRRALLWFQFTTRALGWQAAAAWDPIAGDYACTDGWIRLHTNAPHHRAAALGVLGCAADPKEVAAKLSGFQKDEIEAAIVANHGCAAAMQSLQDWQAHPQGRAVAAEPLIHWDMRGEIPIGKAEHADTLKQNGLRALKVLDLTRVLAGPVATRFLAGFGANVLRIDPPHWSEPAVELEVTLGKTCAGLDLGKSADRAEFERLVSEADLLVHGYRPGALAGIGYDETRLAQLNPRLLDVSLCAYGWSGPWAGRRGFDSLVQMSCGIADAGMRQAKSDAPKPLPVQALDFATGYLVATAALRALRLRQRGQHSSARLSLARTAHMLIAAGQSAPQGENPVAEEEDFARDIEHSSWGAVQRVAAPYTVEGQGPSWSIAAGHLRRHAARW